MNSEEKNFKDHVEPGPMAEISLQNESVPSTNEKHSTETEPLISTSEENSMPTPQSPTIEEISIYNVRTKRQSHLILAALAVTAFLLPFSDTICLPALGQIQDSFNTSQILVAISVSIYLLMSGIFCLLWGAVSDRFGRKITNIVAISIFTVVSIVCIVSPDIYVFIVFRGFEGASVSATLVIGQGIVADMYPENTRGTASGLFFLPINIGPVFGPLIGGPLSSTNGWRSVFIFLAAFSFCVLIVMIFLVPETHQYFVKERFNKQNPSKRIVDAVPDEQPPFEKPWRPLRYLADLTIAPYIAISTTTIATVFGSITLFCTQLGEPPYNYTDTIVGLLFIPAGVALFSGSLFGGWVSDKANQHYGHRNCPEGRLVPALALSLFTPIGLCIFGWAFQYKVNVSVPIIASVMICFGESVFEVSVSAYLTAKKQEAAASVSASNTCLNYCAAAILVTINVPLVHSIGIGFYFTILCVINFAAILLGGVLVYKSIKRTRHIRDQQDSIEPDLQTPLLKCNVDNK